MATLANLVKPRQLLALTGGIASGKSTVSELFRQHGALVISADQVSRELLQPGELGWSHLREEFAGRFFTPEGTVDRVALRQAIFRDPQLRAQIDGILHPLIRSRIAEMLGGSAQVEPPVAPIPPHFRGTLVEVPLLFEAGWQNDFDCVLVVRADDEQSLTRLMLRDGISRSEAVQALAAQMPLIEKIARGQVIIDNRGDLAATALQVVDCIARLTT